MKKVKWCWVATQTVKGWRLRLSIGENPKDDVRLEGLLLEDEKEVKKLVRGGIVFVHRKTVTTKKKIYNK